MAGRLTILAATGVVAVAVGLAGCGSSSPKPDAGKTPTPTLKECLTSHGYAVEPETAQAVRTAPRRFEFLEVWNVVNPNRVTLALAISKSTDGAAQGAAWTRAENAKLGKGVVKAPVVRIGKIDLLWTAPPGVRDAKDVDACVRAHA